MSVWAVMNTKDDVDIIDACIRHTLAEGIERILVSDMSSSDGTREALDTYPQITVYDDPSPVHHQIESMSRLAALAGTGGATWVVPVDADEFWCALTGTITEALESLPEDVGRVYARMWQHHDFERREPDPKPQPKCAFRWAPGCSLKLGNHDVEHVPGYAAHDILEVREIQYRSLEQFAAKIRKQNATFDYREGPHQGTHHRKYTDWTDEQMAAEWARITSVPTVVDPIKTRAVL